MTIKDPAILRAERLRTIINMPEYKDTIGAWITEGRKSALHNMSVAKEPHEFYAAQGEFRAMQQLEDQFERVFAVEKAAVEKHTRKIQKEQMETNNDN